MPKYVLHYFPLNARGEASRMLFKLAGVEFEDKRIPFEIWTAGKLKEQHPLQHLPVLEVDGVQIGDSKAILRFLAKEFGFHGSNNLEGAFLDEVIDTCEDGWAPANQIMRTGGEERKASERKIREELLPKVFTRVNALLSLDRAGDYFLGNSITSADLFFYTLVESHNFYPNEDSSQADCIAAFPKLSALRDRIASNPIIAKWISERPEPVPHPLMPKNWVEKK